MVLGHVPFMHRYVTADSFDLQWLENHHCAILQKRGSELNLECIGMVLKRYPELEFIFARIGVNTAAANAMASNVDLTDSMSPGIGDVQRYLLAMPQIEVGNEIIMNEECDMNGEYGNCPLGEDVMLDGKY